MPKKLIKKEKVNREDEYNAVPCLSINRPCGGLENHSTGQSFWFMLA